MELLELFWMVQYSESPSFAKISQDLFQDGLNQLLLEDILMEINTSVKMLNYQDQESWN